MFDRWKLQDFSPGEGVAGNVFAEQFDTSGWIDIPAPGDVHQALLEAGRIADPFYDRNEDACAWMEEREWWYRLSCESKERPLRQDERFLLVFQGLDTFVSIWLNGELLGKHANMFREAVFDVSQRWRTDGSNTLALCFYPPLQHVENAAFKSWGRNPSRVLMRHVFFTPSSARRTDALHRQLLRPGSGRKPHHHHYESVDTAHSRNGFRQLALEIKGKRS